MRLVIGIMAAAIGAGVVYFSETWIVGAALLLTGAFMVFEARAGWCVVRAMGFRTPL